MALDESNNKVVDEFSLAVVAISKHDDDAYWKRGEEIGQAADDVVRQLSACGAKPVYRADDTTLDGAREFIGAWDSREPCTSSILYWVGHGTSDGNTQILVTSESGRDPDVDDSLATGDLAKYLRKDAKRRRNRGTQSSEMWTVLILDSCGAGVGRANLGAILMGHPPTEPKHLLVVATTGGGTGYLGGFNAALAKVIGAYAVNDPHIPVRDLTSRLLDALDDREPSIWGEVPLHALIRNPRWEGRTVTGPIDAVGDPAALLASRPGAEIAPWFTRREEELARLQAWLTESDRSLQVVTGPAGSGKSALFESFLSRLVGEFDARMLATGATIHNAVQSIARDLFGAEDMREPEPLLRAIERHEGCFRIAVDALDEAMDPHVMAASLLRPLAQMGNVKLLVATRTSLAERQGKAEPDDRGILEALGSPEAQELALGPDQELTRAYVRHYLAPAFPDPEKVERIAAETADRQQPLLFARLVVTELLAGAARESEEAFGELIGGDIATAFNHARARIAAAQPPIHALLRTLAFAAGRGFPRLGDIWLTAARALHPGQAIEDDDIATALTHRPREASQVAPYIMLDAEHDQSTYRLSHRSFLEQFEQTEEQLGSPLAAHTHIARALLAAAIDADALSPYVARYLPWHLARSEPSTWQELADHPAVLDALVPSAVAAEAMSVAAEQALPPEILGLVASRHRVVRARPDDREGLRQVGMASCAADGTYARPTGQATGPGMAWSVRSAVLRPHPIHMTLLAGSRVTSLACLDGAEGVCLLAAGCQDGTVWLWNAVSGESFGDPIEVSDRPVLAIAAAAAADDAPARFVVGDAGGRIGLWDTLAREPVDSFESEVPVRVLASFRDEQGEQRIVADGAGCTAQVWSIHGERLARFENHRGDVCALAGPLPGKQTIVASAGKDEVVRLWDPATGNAIGEPLEGHRAWVKALARFEDLEGRDRLASGGDDEAILIWDISDGRNVPEPLRIKHSGGRVGTLCTYTADDGALRLVSGGSDGTVRVWDPAALAEACSPLAGHGQAVTALALCAGEGLTPCVASVGEDDQICVWNPALARSPGTLGTDVFVGVTALATRAGEGVILSAGDDGVVRCWDRATGTPAGDPLRVCSGPVPALVAYRDARAAERAASADGDVVLLWHSDDPLGSRIPLYGHEAPVRVISSFATADGTQLLASGDHSGVIHLWNATTGEEVGEPIGYRHGVVYDIAAYVSEEEDTRLVAVGERTIRAWSLRSPEEVMPIGSHEDWVTRAATFVTAEGPRLVTSSADATLRLWDPEGAEELDRLDCGDEPVLALAVLAGGEAPALIAGGDDGGTVWIWSPLSESPWRRAIPLELPISSLLWCGEDLLVGTAEGHVVLDASGLR